jgi:hypothetical protein
VSGVLVSAFALRMVSSVLHLCSTWLADTHKRGNGGSLL